jgi:hypothetical protein
MEVAPYTGSQQGLRSVKGPREPPPHSRSTITEVFTDGIPSDHILVAKEIPFAGVALYHDYNFRNPFRELSANQQSSSSYELWVGRLRTTAAPGQQVRARASIVTLSSNDRVAVTFPNWVTSMVAPFLSKAIP